MKRKHFCICILAALFVLPTLGAFAQTIQVVEVFNFPAGGVGTLPQKINDGGDVAGVIDAFTGERRGFVRFRNGSFTPSIVEPNDTAGFTDLRGINNSRLVNGSYIADDGLYHGFFATGNSFTTFDVPGATNTILLADNNAGDFCGGYSTATNTNFTAFISVGGTITTITVPDATSSFAYGINSSNEVVGQYTDSGGTAHAFFRDSAGTVTAPADPPGAIAGVLFGLNDRGFMVGRFTDASGVERGYAQTPSGSVFVLDKPDASLTSLNGINNTGLMCGRFTDLSGVAHGVIARLGRPTAEAAHEVIPRIGRPTAD